MTSFDRATFATGGGTVTLGSAPFSATFAGFQQEQSFDGPAYSAGPDALFAINGSFVGSFGRTLADTSDVATITFSSPASTVSFNAADRANGTPRILVFDDALNELANIQITATSNRDAESLLTFNAADLGAPISSIQIDNAGPAGNPPYVTAIDSFSATAIPEPSTAILGILGLGALAVRRRR